MDLWNKRVHPLHAEEYQAKDKLWADVLDLQRKNSDMRKEMERIWDAVVQLDDTIFSLCPVSLNLQDNSIPSQSLRNPTGLASDEPHCSSSPALLPVLGISTTTPPSPAVLDLTGTHTDSKDSYQLIAGGESDTSCNLDCKKEMFRPSPNAQVDWISHFKKGVEEILGELRKEDEAEHKKEEQAIIKKTEKQLMQIFQKTERAVEKAREKERKAVEKIEEKRIKQQMKKEKKDLKTKLKQQDELFKQNLKQEKEKLKLQHEERLAKEARTCGNSRHLGEENNEGACGASAIADQRKEKKFRITIKWKGWK